MFENIFTPSPMTWAALAGGLFALPILIHLINMMRHRKVKWAAMEFLLKSHKKHRNYVWLKQLLLLLSRIAALLLALFTLGQIGCSNDSFARFLGGKTTHHYILLDDSFSMEDQSTQTSSFDRAREVLALVAARARGKQNQKFTLLRFSQADVKFDESSSPQELAQQFSVVADINGQIVDSQFDQLLEDVRTKLGSTELSVGPQAALETTEQLIRSRENENAWVYVVSDFRRKDWANSPELQQKLAALAEESTTLELIRCVDNDAANLAITELAPIGNVRVANIPLMMSVSVKNFSATTASKVQIDVNSIAYDDTTKSFAGAAPGKLDELPTVFIEEIKPGETETRQFPVFFPATGQQVVTASLEKDSVTSDNRAYAVVGIEPSAKILIIDNDQQLNASYLSRAISPSGMTGIAPEVQQKEFLRDTSLDKLGEFDVIYLTDVDRLEETAVKNLEAYVNAGGGLCIFIGPYSNLAFYSSEMYREGLGLLPFPLEKSIDIPELLEDRIPDIAPRQHLFFKPVLGMKNSPLDLVQVKKIARPPLEWSAKSHPEIEIAATVRGENNFPLIATKNFGKGRVACITTTAIPMWNNWARNGTFPATLLIMEDWLATGSYQQVERTVGQPLTIEFSDESFGNDVTFTMPGSDINNRLETSKTASQNPAAETRIATLGGANPELRAEVARAGIYEAWLQAADSAESRRFAFNVDTSESDLAVMEPQILLKQYEAASPKISRWDQFSSEIQKNTVSSLSKLLLVILILILIGEQILAYSASYHPKRSVARA